MLSNDAKDKLYSAIYSASKICGEIDRKTAAGDPLTSEEIKIKAKHEEYSAKVIM